MLVRIKKEWLDDGDNGDTIYQVVEDNGDRKIIRENRLQRFEGEIISTELVRSHMIEEV